MRTWILVLLVAGCGGKHKDIGPSNVGQESAAAAASGSNGSPGPSTSSTTNSGDTGMGAPATPADAKLAVTSAAPVEGDYEGGTYVVLRGARFIKDGPRQLKVYFDGKQGSVVRFQSDSEVIVQAPPGKLGQTVDILLVFDPGGQLKLPSAFKYIDKADVPSVDDLDNKKK